MGSNSFAGMAEKQALDIDPDIIPKSRNFYGNTLERLVFQ